MSSARHAEARSRQPSSDVAASEEASDPAPFADRPIIDAPPSAQGQPSGAAPTPYRPKPNPPNAQEAAGSDSEEPAVGDLLKQLTDQTKTLVKQEVRLAQVELQEKGKKLGIGAGLFGAGGLVAFFGAATLIVALVLLIATALAPWLSALIVAVLLLAAAGAAALKGKQQIEQATPPVPEQAAETVKEDVQHVKERAKEGKP
jgi:uncharacterized membrane protein YqjE